MLSKETLNGNWWYRSLQVIYILSFIITVFISIIVINENSLPEVNAYASTYYFKCNSDGVLRGNIKGSERGSDYYDDNYNSITRFVCSDVKFLEDKDFATKFGKAYNDAKMYNLIPKSNNFEYVIKDKVYTNTWSNYSWLIFLDLLVMLIIWLVVRFIFLYIVLGKETFQYFRKIFSKK